MHWVGICLGILYWFLESALDSFVFHEGRFTDRLFTPDPNELWMRLAIISILVIFGFFAQSSINRRLRAEEEVKKLNKDLELRVIERTVQLETANKSLAQKIIELKEAQEEVEKSLSLLHATLESTADGILVVNNEGKIVGFNQKFIDMWRIPEPIISSRDDNQTLTYVLDQLNDPEGFLGKVRELYSQPDVESYDVLEFKEGRIFERYSQPQRIGEKGVGRVWSFRDVTDRKQAEGALKVERNKLMNILESMEDGVYIVNQAYDIEYVNPVIEREFGHVEGRKCYEYFHDRDEVCSWCKNKKVFAGKTVRWEWYSAKNNKTYDLLDTPLRNYDGSISKLEIFRDITERRQAEEELKTSYNLLHTVIEEIIDAIFVKDIRGCYLLINDPGARLIGKAKEEVIGKDDSELFVPEAARQIMEDDRRIIDSGMTRTYEEDLVAASGLRHTYLTTKGPFRNHEGKVIGVIGIARDITERKHEEEMIQHLAYYDVLTGLPNRTLLHDRLQQAIFEAKSGNRPLVLLVMDLDRFKEINNTLGHHSGDIILKQTGDRLRNALPETAILARTGGDEFAVILPDTDAESANRIADSFMKSLKEPFTLEGIAINVNASIGMVPFPGYGDDANTLMQYADMAMYRAKNTKSGLTIYSPQYNQYSPERLTLIGELRHSIDSDQMFLLYQPKIDLKTGSPVGVEALVRWQHPRLGVIPPNQFIALAEHTGLIKDLTLWVIKEALRQSHAWKQEGLKVCVAVNLSMQNLQVPELLEQIKVLLSTSSMTPDNLRLELTESTIMRDPERSMDILAQLAAIDIHFSIDDFGTGYSSLGYLQKLPVDEIKIDKSFVINMMEDEHSIAIVHSIIELAHSLRLKVVAEGVENKEIMKRLGLLGCDMAQGYFISRPIPGSELKGWLELGVKGD